jgi:diketogulonate reductase-like aldo/keto reductase
MDRSLPRTRTGDKLRENATAAGLDLTSSDIQRIDDVLDQLTTSAVFGVNVS